MTPKAIFLLSALLLSTFASGLQAGEFDEFKVKREAVYEFAAPPVLSRDGDRVTVAFETKGNCDVTVAVEDADGRIVRHLASGVLGNNAPAPFTKDSRKQVLVWDGKDDQGRYIDDASSHSVRVSLGLKPQFERSLYWSPHKRLSEAPPLLQATEEGVLLYDAKGNDSLKLFSHDGDYVRTVYPFPGDKLESVKGLDWHDFPQGVRLPRKHHYHQQTLLLGGNNARKEAMYKTGGMLGRAATGLAARGGRVALVFHKLCNLGLDGSSGGVNLNGPKASVSLKHFRILYTYENEVEIGATSAAVSPDGKWLYLSGYGYRYYANWDFLHCVYRMPMDGSAPAQPFLGGNADKVVTENDWQGSGTGPGQFRNATSVDCDEAGRVYVSDFMNDRVQIFSPEGQHLKDLKVEKPAVVRINRRNGEVFAFTWPVFTNLLKAATPNVKIVPALSRFEPFESLALKKRYKLPLPEFSGRYMTNGNFQYTTLFTGEIDPWDDGDMPTVWIGRECRNDQMAGTHPGDGGKITKWEDSGTLLLREENGALKVVRDFAKDTSEAVAQSRPPINAIQHLIVNPLTGKLYIAEADSAPTIKASTQWVEVDPESGKTKLIDLPFNPVEGTFDLNGRVYLRSTDMVARYDFRTWREVPWDYGEEREKLGGDGGIFGKVTSVIGGLKMPATSPVCYHQGGIYVNAKGNLLASCAWRNVASDGTHYLAAKGEGNVHGADAYKPQIYPGRAVSPATPCLHIWDKHGQVLVEDALPGIELPDGVGLDSENNIYLVESPARMAGGNPYFNEFSETLLKVKPKNVKVVSDSPNHPVPLPETERPKRAPDMYMGRMGQSWAEGAEWFYGGIGYGGSNSNEVGGICACWFTRFVLDYFARSIAVETHSYSVAVLDSNGNLILRIGRYGNLDGGGYAGGEAEEDDGVRLFHPLFVGTHTDRRIFISDIGNGRIAGVKLGYHLDARLALKDAK